MKTIFKHIAVKQDTFLKFRQLKSKMIEQKGRSIGDDEFQKKLIEEYEEGGNVK